MNFWMIAGMLLAALIGALLPLQALLNARLGSLTQGPLFASFVSFLVGTLALGIALATTRTTFPSASNTAHLPVWLWTGGLIGALYVGSATMLVPRLGAAALVCIVVFGQVAGSLLLDHFGVLNVPRPVDATRLFGAALVAVGALLVVRPWQDG